MADNKNDTTGEDILSDADSFEVFNYYLDVRGLVVSSVPDGVLVGISREKLEELLQVAKDSEEQRVIIFVHKDPPEDTFN